MKKITIDNYDGEKGYLGKDKLNVVKLNGKIYLLSGRGYNTKSWTENEKETEAYKVIKDEIELDCAVAVRVRDRKTLAEIIKKRTKDIKKIEDFYSI